MYIEHQFKQDLRGCTTRWMRGTTRWTVGTTRLIEGTTRVSYMFESYHSSDVSLTHALSLSRALKQAGPGLGEGLQKV